MSDEDGDDADLGGGRISVALVNISLERQPLEEALRQMRLQATFNVVMDSAVGEKVQTRLTLTLLNAPFDSALQVLTELADLDYVWLDNIFYLTSREKARSFAPPGRPGVQAQAEQ